MHGIANGYFEDTDTTKEMLNQHESLFKEFMQKTINFKNQHIIYERNLLLFISFLELNNINYLINGNIFLNPKMGNAVPDFSNKLLKFKLRTGEVVDLVRYFNSYKLTLEDETRGVIKDGHCGYVGNKIISELIYNQLIDYGYLNSNKIEITDYTIDVIFEPNGYTELTNFSQLDKFFL
jgi:hypothetical protein